MLVKDIVPPHIIMVMAMSLLMVAQVISVEDALEGFSNEGLITIGVLFVVAKAVEVNEALNLVVKYFLRKPSRVSSLPL